MANTAFPQALCFRKEKNKSALSSLLGLDHCTVSSSLTLTNKTLKHLHTRRQRQVEGCELRASLAHRASFRLAELHSEGLSQTNEPFYLNV